MNYEHKFYNNYTIIVTTEWHDERDHGFSYLE